MLTLRLSASYKRRTQRGRLARSSDARLRGAGAVLHTHSVWDTILSDAYASGGDLCIEGYEMLKGLSGVTTHEHREWLSIIENSQEYEGLGRAVGKVL